VKWHYRCAQQDYQVSLRDWEHFGASEFSCWITTLCYVCCKILFKSSYRFVVINLQRSIEKEPNKNQKQIKLEHISMHKSGDKGFISKSEMSNVAFHCFSL
jgi:hypothetical protein